MICWPGHIPPGRTTEQVAISMDWLPTLLAAAGTVPDPAYPPDGMNLLPALTENAAPRRRKLFWRYKANAQRAARDGDYKFLKILDNTFLFNVVEDPLERANLKDRDKELYDGIVAEWQDWNASMLPEDPGKLHRELHRQPARRSLRRPEGDRRAGHSLGKLPLGVCPRRRQRLRSNRESRTARETLSAVTASLPSASGPRMRRRRLAACDWRSRLRHRFGWRSW